MKLLFKNTLSIMNEKTWKALKFLIDLKNKIEIISLRWVCQIKCLQCFECPSACLPECLSSQVLSKCSSVQVIFDCSCASSAEVPFVCPSAVPKHSSNALGVTLTCYLSILWVPNSPFSALRIKKFWNITRNGPFHSFIGFSKTFQNTYFT